MSRVPHVPSAGPVPPILALASSGVWCSVGLAWPDPLGRGSAERGAPGPGLQFACASEPAGLGHSQRLLPLARELLSQAGLEMADIGLIAFDAGPGSFTGLRIGCGLAQGLALGLGCPVAPVSSLRALAWPHRHLPVLAATDARMGEVYIASWPRVRGADLCESQHDDPLAAGAPVDGAFVGTSLVGGMPADGLADEALAVGPPERLAERIRQLGAAHGRGGAQPGFDAQPTWVATGDAFARYPELAALAGAQGARVLADTFARADHLAELAAIAWSRGQVRPPDAAGPIYVRNKVALDVDEQRALRQARDAAR